MRRVARARVLGVVAVAALAGCGSDSGSSSSSSTSSSSGASAAVPADLLGTYATKLKQGDLPPSPPPELTAGSGAWRLTIAKSGGVNGGNAFSIADPAHGELETSSFVVKGDTITLVHEECAAGGTENFYDNQYRFTKSGNTLKFTTVKNQCPDKIAETILTKEPWKQK